MSFHKIRSGRITAVQVLNSCFYAVRCSECYSTSEIHQHLQSSELSHPVSIKISELVAVRHFNYRWYRGIVVGTTMSAGDDTPCRHYKVYLYDVMQTVVTNKTNIYRSDSEFLSRSIPAQLHVIGLSGGIPSQKSPHLGLFENVDLIVSLQNQRIWNFLKECSSLEFDEKFTLKNISFGDLRAIKSERIVDLFEMTCQAGYLRVIENVDDEMLLSGWMFLAEKRMDSIYHASGIQVKGSVDVIPTPRFRYGEHDSLELKRLNEGLSSSDKIIPYIVKETHEEFISRLQESCHRHSQRNRDGCTWETQLEIPASTQKVLTVSEREKEQNNEGPPFASSDGTEIGDLDSDELPKRPAPPLFIHSWSDFDSVSDASSDEYRVLRKNNVNDVMFSTDPGTDFSFSD